MSRQQFTTRNNIGQPLGLDCDSIDTTTPDDTNGIVVLYITETQIHVAP